MTLKEKLSAIFILLRPYSLPGLFLLYYVAKVIVTKNLGFNLIDLLTFIPVFLAWAYFILLLESEHKHSNRIKIPLAYPVIILIFTIILAVIFNGLVPIIPLIFILIFTFTYTKKNSIQIIGNASFIVRGLVETSLFFFSLSMFTNNYLQLPVILFGLVIFLTTSARNLLGDIRDTKFDKVTFSVRFSNKLGYIVSILLYALGGYLLFTLSNGMFGVIAPIILMIIALFVVDNGYMFHRLSVVLSTIIIASYLLFISGNTSLILLLNIIFLTILCNLMFYNLVPRESNPFDLPTKFGIAPWFRTLQTKKLESKTNTKERL